jgi:RNA polymerase sigma-70 factor (ECF subfamily)
MSLRPVLRAVAARILRVSVSHADVDDCVAETFRRMVEGRARLRPGEPLAPWATGIARHVALDLVRQRRRQAPEPGDAPAPELADPGPSPEESAEQAQRLASLRRALAEIDDGPRQALLAFHVEGLSYVEIGRRLGVPMGTVATWISRSRKTLGAALGASGLATVDGPRKDKVGA